MKKIVLSTVVVALSSFAVAGGDVAPIVPVEPTEGNFYLGAGYSCLDITQAGIININDNFNAVMLQAGYKFNPYVALEGRYWIGLEETLFSDGNIYTGSTVDTWGIYVKPMYPVTNEIDIYGLAGYAKTDNNLVVDSIDSLSLGLGLAYSFTENIGVFADYTNLFYGDSDFPDANKDVGHSYNFGVSYQF